MKVISTLLTIIITAIVSSWLSFNIGYDKGSNIAPKEVKVYRDFKLGEWKCTDSNREWDLLQPTGYWINHNFDCWKKEMELDEYCFKYQCSTDWYKNYYQELKDSKK